MKHYHVISKITIYLLAVVLIILGVFHFYQPHELVVYVPVSVPGGIVGTYFVGGAFIVVGISFITNKWVKFTGYVLAVVMLLFIIPIHFSNALYAGDKEMKSIAFISLLKDTVIACFALHIAAGAYHQKLHLENSD
jgi:putative oxidoreductase